MPTKTPTQTNRAAATRETTDSALGAFNMLADLPRRQMAFMTQAASALARGTEALRNIQQQAAMRATAHQQEIAERLGGHYDFTDLLAIQADLLRFNIQEATQYWQELTSAGMRIQADMVSSAGEAAMNTAAEPTLDTLQRAFEATLNGTGAAATAH